MRRIDDFNELPTFRNYQRLATATALYPGRDSFAGFCYGVFKLGSEAGEVSGKAGKLFRDLGIEWGSDPKQWPEEVRQGIKSELGDVLWYIAAVARELGYSIQDVAGANIDKLEGREERGTVHGDGDNR